MSYSSKIKWVTGSTFSLLLFLVIVFSSPLNSRASDLFKNIFIKKVHKQLKAGQYDQAIKQCENLKKLHINRDYVYLLEGLAYYSKKDFQTAANMFTQSILLNENRGDAFYYRSISFSRMNNENDALSDINTAIQNKKTVTQVAMVNKNLGHNNTEDLVSSDLYWQRSGIFFRAKQYEKALIDINHAIAIRNKPLHLLHILKAYCYLNQKKTNTAYSEFEKAYEINSKSMEALSMLSVIDFYNGNYKKDIENCRKILELNPKNSTVHTNMALGYWLQGDKEKAVNILETVEQLKENSISCFHLAFFYHKQNKQDKALDYFTKANQLNGEILKLRFDKIKLPPESSPTKSFYKEEYNIAKTYIETGKTPNKIASENKPQTIIITNLSVNPNPVPVNTTFKIHLSFKADAHSPENVITPTFRFTITQNDNILFESKNTISTNNGELTHWQANMEPVPVKGNSTVPVFPS